MEKGSGIARRGDIQVSGYFSYVICQATVREKKKKTRV